MSQSSILELPIWLYSPTPIISFSLQEKRVNAVILEMQKKLWLKDAMLNQLKTIVMEEQTDSDHEAHEMQKQKPNPETEKSLLERRLACSTPIPVRCV